MRFFKKWMFSFIKTKVTNKKEYIVEELEEKPIVEEAPKVLENREKMIVIFLYLLMGICSVSLLTGIILLVIKHDYYKEVLIVFSTSLSYLVGYFFGTNKKRGE